MIRSYSLLLLLALVSPVVNACKCDSWLGKQSATAIFAGEVIAIKKYNKGFYVKFRADTVLNGRLKKQVIVRTALLSACGFHFAKGQKYLVYGKWRSARVVNVNMCTRTKRIRAIRAKDLELEND